MKRTRALINIVFALLLLLQIASSQQDCVYNDDGVCIPRSGTPEEHDIEDSYDEDFEDDYEEEEEDYEEYEEGYEEYEEDYEEEEEEEVVRRSGGQTTGGDLGVPQTLDPANHDDILDVLREARVYMFDIVNVDTDYELVRGKCFNKHHLCGYWAVQGFCESDATYMSENCAPVCQTCEMLHVEVRCPMTEDLTHIWAPGDLNKMFERIISNPDYEKYQPNVLSSPSNDTEDEENDGPWIVTLDNFLSEAECQRMIELGAEEGYERSSDVGEIKEDGSVGEEVNSGRTSQSAWCETSCYEDELAIRVMDNIADITQIPEKNSEHLQLLRYEEGQFYGVHHDYIPYQRRRQCGVRILTVFLYLNDVEEGGGTNFPSLDLTVMPKCGRAVIWPSVHDNAPNNRDYQTEHQALPVIKGMKYGANAWLHQHDYKTPNLYDCT